MRSLPTIPERGCGWGDSNAALETLCWTLWRKANMLIWLQGKREPVPWANIGHFSSPKARPQPAVPWQSKCGVILAQGSPEHLAILSIGRAYLHVTGQHWVPWMGISCFVSKGSWARWAVDCVSFLARRPLLTFPGMKWLKWKEPSLFEICCLNKMEKQLQILNIKT